MSETLNRLVYGLMIGSFGLFMIYVLTPQLMAVLMFGIALAASYEYRYNLRLKGATLPAALLVANCLIPLGALIFFGEVEFFVSLASIAIGYYLLRQGSYLLSMESGVDRMSWIVLHLFWISMPICMFYQLRVSENGFMMILFLILMNTLGDTSAYFIGKYFGRVKLNLAASPNKTLEGFLASFFTSLMGGVIFLSASGRMDIIDAIVLSMLINISAQTGDLLESKYKRFCGIKDSSTLIPGHGGVMDRLDSYFLSTPMLFLWVFFFGSL